MRLAGLLQFILFLLISINAYAQYKISDLDLDGDLESWYDQKIGKNNAGIISGKFVEIKRMSKGTHQFFQSSEWAPSQVVFRGQTYDSINLLYDLHRDIMCIRHPTNLAFHDQAIELPKSQVERFIVHGHEFRFLDNVPSSRLPGFYDALFDHDQISIIVKRMKSMEIRQEVNFVDNDFYFFQIDQTFYRYWGKRTALRLFKPFKAEIKKFIRQNDLVLKPNYQNDSDIIELASFLTSLNSGNE